MSIVDNIMEKYRAMPMHGIQFSVDPGAYDCNEKVCFGDNTMNMQCGQIFNWQDVILDGKCIGFLEEIDNGKLFDPMTVSFYVPLDESKITDTIRSSKHFHEDEFCYMRFATLQQMIDYVMS